MLNLIIALVLDALLTGVFLWVGMKAVAMFMGMQRGAVYCAYWQLVIAAAAAAVVSLIQGVGWVLSILVLFVLMMKFTEAGFLEVLMMVLMARIVSALAVLLLAPALA